MCQFISWIRKGDLLLYLTYNDIYNTKAGKELQKFCGCTEDLVGHGAIRHYYNFVGGIEFECTDFSNPKNFPAKIVEAIKAGKFAGLGIAEQLLTESAHKEYSKIEQPAHKDYRKIEQSAHKDYEQIEHSAHKEYSKIQQPAYKDYKKIEQSAYKNYKKIEQSAFWDLFKVKKNRPKCWR